MGIFDMFKKNSNNIIENKDVETNETNIVNEKEEEVPVELKEVSELYHLIEWCREEATKEEILDVRYIFSYDSFKNLYKYNQENSENDAKVAAILENSLNHMDISKACAIAHYCGVLIEKSGVFGIGFGLVDLFEKVVNLTYDFINIVSNNEEFKHVNLQGGNVEDEVFTDLIATYINEAKAFKGAELVTLAVMDVITRKPEVRDYLRSKNLYKKINFLQPYVKSIVYIEMVHDACNDLKVMVLCPESRKGFYMKAYDIHNCFYLMTLIEAEIYRKGWQNDYGLDGYEFDEELYNIAIGNKHPDRLYTIESHSLYQNYYAVKEAKENPQYSPLKFHIFGEMPPEYIPKYKGCPVLVMSTDSIHGRMSWDSNFTFKCHEGMDPHIEIMEELSENQVDEILENLISSEIQVGEKDSVYERKMLEILNHTIKNSTLNENSVIISDIGLDIHVKFVEFQNNVVQAEFRLNHEYFIEELREFVIGIGNNIYTALSNAVNSFCNAALTGILSALSKQNGEDFESDFNGTRKQFQLYRSKKANNGYRENFIDTDYWNIIRDEIRKRLGNKPVYWIKVYLSKNFSDISCECRINDIVSNEITEILNKTAEQWNITTQFCDEKQYFVLVQDRSTYVPYRFSREQVIKYTLETIDLYKDCNTEEKYDELFRNVYKICNDISLSLDLMRFIPEMLCQIIFPDAKYQEYYFMIDEKNNNFKIYKDSVTAYNWIFDTLYRKFREGYFNRNELQNIVGLSATIKSFNDAFEKGSKMEDISSTCCFPIDDDYVIG